MIFLYLGLQKNSVACPATTYEPSEGPGLRITNPSVWIKEAPFFKHYLQYAKRSFINLTIFSWKQQTLFRWTLACIILKKFFIIIRGCLFKYVNFSQSLLCRQLSSLEVIDRRSLKPFAKSIRSFSEHCPILLSELCVYDLFHGFYKFLWFFYKYAIHIYDEISGLCIICCELFRWIS